MQSSSYVHEGLLLDDSQNVTIVNERSNVQTIHLTYVKCKLVFWSKWGQRGARDMYTLIDRAGEESSLQALTGQGPRQRTPQQRDRVQERKGDRAEKTTTQERALAIPREGRHGTAHNTYFVQRSPFQCSPCKKLMTANNAKDRRQNSMRRCYDGADKL